MQGGAVEEAWKPLELEEGDDVADQFGFGKCLRLAQTE
jgi:hypothetical protein